MAGIGAGFGAFADGMSSGYMMGKQIKDNQEQRRIEEEQQEQRRREEEERQRQTEAMRANLLQQQPAQQGGMGIDPSTAMSAMQAFGGGSAGGTAAGGTAGGAAGSTAGGSSAAGSGIAAAGPWAALAAIIAVNERSARNGGHRRDGFDYVKDLGTGKVLSQDVNERWVPKLGGYDSDKTGLLHDAGAGAEFLSLDFKDGFKKLREGGTVKAALNGIKKIF